MEETKVLKEKLKSNYVPQIDYDAVPRILTTRVLEPVSQPLPGLPEEEENAGSEDPFIGAHHLPTGSVTLRKDKLLGSGAFGQVFQEQWGERLVALKELNIKLAQEKLGISEEEVLEALQWEVSRLSTLSHANLVQFYGLYQQDNQTYLVMEFCEGGNLQHALETQKPNWSVRWQWALEITQGLTYLHHQGTLHRDLKAENVLLDKHQRARLADLGVAQVDALLQRSEAKVVAEGFQDRHFIAPEIYKSGLSTPASDIYALGLVFWQLATQGKKPHRLSPSSIPTEGCWEHEVIPADCLLPMKELILDCWQLEPSKRPSAEQIVERLNHVAAQFHPKPDWVKLCENADTLIHSTRSEALKYIAPYVARHPVTEDLDTYWSRLENQGYQEKEFKQSQGEAKTNGEQMLIENSPLTLTSILEDFLQAPEFSSLLLLGEAGLGKTLSTYQLADKLLSQFWEYLKNPKGTVPYYPVLIRPMLSNWSYSGLRDALPKSFEHLKLSFTESELHQARWLIIVDSYDECQTDMAPGNLAQQLGLGHFPNAKLLVTCRPNIVSALELQNRFALKGNLIVRYFLPFNITQMLDYLKRELCWDSNIQAQYQQKFQQTHALRAVLRNPFVLSLLVESWGTVSKKDFNQLNRWQIYEGFVEHWINTKQFSLSNTLKNILKGKHSTLLESFNAFSSEIAFSAFQKKSIFLDVKTAAEHLSHSHLWFNLREQVIKDSQKNFLLRQKQLSGKAQRRALLSEQDYSQIMFWRLQQFEAGCPLKNRILSFDFRHKSFFEYFVAKRIIQLREKNHASIVEEALELLNHRLIQSEPGAMMFMAEGWQENNTHNLVAPLLEILEHSKKEGFKHVQASANAATILNVGRIPFSGMNLVGIRIPEADLSRGILDGTNLQGADLSNVNFQGAWLRETDLSKTNMNQVKFGTDISSFLKIADIHCCCYSSDGALLAVGSGNVIYLYETKNFRVYHIFSGHTDVVNGVTFGTNGWFVSASSDGSVRIWNIQKKSLEHIFTLEKGQKTNKLIINSEGDIEEQPMIHRTRATCVALSLNHRWLAVGSSSYFGNDPAGQAGIVWIWDIERKQLLHAFDVHKGAIKETHYYVLNKGPKEGGSEKIKKRTRARKDCAGVTSIAFGEKYLASTGEEGTVQIWRLPINSDSIFELLGTIGEKNGVEKKGVAWSPEGLLAFGNEEGLISVYDIEQECRIHVFAGHGGAPIGGGITSLVFGKNNLLISSGNDGSVRMWDYVQKHLLYAFEDSKDVKIISMAISPDEYIAAGTVDGTVKILDLKQNRELLPLIHHTHFGQVNDVTVLASEGWIASGGLDCILNVWDINNKKLIFTVDNIHHGVYCVKFLLTSQGKTYLASSGEDGSINFWDVKENSLIHTLQGSEASIYAIAAGPQGWLASGGVDGVIRVWDIQQKSPIYVLEGHSSMITSLAFDYSTGLLVSGGYDATVKVWDVKQKCSLYTFKGVAFRAVALGPNKWLAAADITGIVWVWDLSEKQLLYTFENRDMFEHEDGIHRLSFGPHGWLAIGGRYKDEGRIQVWDIEKQHCIMKIEKLPNTVLSLDWIQNKEGIFLFTGSSDKAVRCFKVVSDEKGFCLRLNWASQPDLLYKQGANIQNVLGLSAKDVGFFEGHDVHEKQEHEKQALEFNYKTNFNFDKTINGKSLLMISVLNNQLDIVRYLVQQKIELNQPEMNTGMTPLELAESIGHHEIAQFLIEVGVKRAAKNKKSGLPLLQEISSLHLEDKIIQCIASSLDGKWLAGGVNEEIYIWECENNLLRHVLKGHTDEVESIHFSPDNQMLVSGGADCNVILWDMVKFELIKVLKSHTDKVTSVSFSPFGTLVASSSRDSTIRLWRVHQGTLGCTMNKYTTEATNVYFSSSGKLLASADCDGNICVWAGGIMMGSKSIDPFYRVQFNDTCFKSVCFCPNRSLVAAGATDGDIILWNFEEESEDKQVVIIKGEQPVEHLQFSPDGNMLVYTSGEIITYRFIETGVSGSVFVNHEAPISDFHFKSDNIIVSSGLDGSICFNKLIMNPVMAYKPKISPMIEPNSFEQKNSPFLIQFNQSAIPAHKVGSNQPNPSFQGGSQLCMSFLSLGKGGFKRECLDDKSTPLLFSNYEDNDTENSECIEKNSPKKKKRCLDCCVVS